MNSDNLFAPIAALDLDPIKVKLMHKESGEGWSLAYADEVEFEYRRFLYLMKKFPHEQVAPLVDVDTFWHYHILDTMKYAADCEAVFGYFLHHFPYVGLRGEDDLEAHHRVGQRMQELYEETYGEGYIRKAKVAPSAAYSIASKPEHAQSTAYSIASKPGHAQSTAYSIASKPEQAQPAAYSIAQSETHQALITQGVDSVAFSIGAGGTGRPSAARLSWARPTISRVV